MRHTAIAALALSLAAAHLPTRDQPFRRRTTAAGDDIPPEDIDPQAERVRRELRERRRANFERKSCPTL